MMRSSARAAFAIALGLGLLHYAPARADNYPTKPITIIVSLAAGTGMDTLVRVYGEKLSQALGQPVIIENKPGGAGVVAGETITKGAPDGYTLAVATSAVMSIRPTLFKVRPFDPLTDFVPISNYVKSPFVLVVNPSLPVKTAREFIAYAKERPGKLSYSSSGIGGAPHLTMELLKQKFGFDIAHVPYRNSPQSIADVAAGHVHAAIAEAGASLPLIKDGKLRALAVTSATRFPSIPDVPPLAEAVGMPGLEGRVVARHLCPQQHAARDRGAAAWRDEAHHGHARNAAEDSEYRPDPERDALGGRHPGLYQGRDREVGRPGAAIGACRLAVTGARLLRQHGAPDLPRWNAFRAEGLAWHERVRPAGFGRPLERLQQRLPKTCRCVPRWCGFSTGSSARSPGRGHR